MKTFIFLPLQLFTLSQILQQVKRYKLSFLRTDGEIWCMTGHINGIFYLVSLSEY